VSADTLRARGFHDWLVAECLPDPVLGVATVALTHRASLDRCSTYLAALREAVRRFPPPFGTDAYAQLYREASELGEWLAVSLMTNAEREGDGATRLWSLAACCPDAEERRLLKRHAVDESHHALAYLSLLDRCFPDAMSSEFHAQLRTLSPHYAMSQDVVAVEGSPYARQPTVDDYVQMNIAEIRTAIHHTMQRGALTRHAHPESMSGITKILDAILVDELNHVGYSAELIQQKVSSLPPDALAELVARRLQDFSQITRDELGTLVFD